MPLIPHRSDRYLRSPTFRVRESRIVLYAIGWHTDGEAIVEFDIASDGQIVAERTGARCSGIVALSHDDVPAASADLSLEHCARASEWTARVEHVRGVSHVYVTLPDRREVLVWSAEGTAASPALATTADGAWLAFHHDVREDTGTCDIPKWIALYFVNSRGEVFEPDAAMCDRDRDRCGVEQSFEFPSLIAHPTGAVTVFGRGSHNFWRQDLTDIGYGPRIGLSDGEWGSRGRRCASVLVGDAMLAACRERDGILVTRLDPPSGTAPRLRRVHPRAVRSSTFDIVAAKPDPAARHGLHTFFGDIQQHSAHSDGIGGADEPYLRARYRYGDDFVALTDHESFIGKRTGPGEWEYLQSVADHHYDAGRFATLLAYEWTGKRYPGPGHKCVYYPRRGIPIVSRDDVPEGAELVRRVRELGGFASPHHIGWTGCDEAGHEPGGQPLWEICSCHGCYEHADHPLGQRGDLHDQMVDTMLNRGHRFGFTASSDGHGLLWHHGESRKRDPFRTGLTAVQAAGCTRDDIMTALMTRRCYATSGTKILLDFTADGHPMGSELPTKQRARFAAAAVGTAEIACIEFVGPGGVLANHCGSGSRNAELTADLDTPWLYARIVQADGEMAWSSPIFFG